MARFELFAILGGMRTGSNLLEATLSEVEGITCHGEAFNPSFVGYPKRTELLGLSKARRDAAPLALIDLIRASPGLNGFRYFNDHDPRVLAPILDDPACAKIVLTRNPLNSYLSLKAAKATGQWKLSHAKDRRAARVTFDIAEFMPYLDEVRAFHGTIRRALQRSGQTAFWIDYDELHDAEVLTGLLRFLGHPGTLGGASRKLVPQNPGPVDRKVANFAAMEAALAGLDPFELMQPPAFEPARGPAVPTYLAAKGARVLYLPLPGGPGGAIGEWLAGLGPPPLAGVQSGFTQKTLRQWLRAAPGHTSFTVLRHPALRTFAAYEELAALTDPETLAALVGTEGPLPAGHPGAFKAFLEFLKANLAGQTPVRTLPAWASQTACLAGIAGFLHPDHVLREDRLAAGLRFIAEGLDAAHVPEPDQTLTARFAEIYDAEIEAAARAAYRRDYETFGFGDWSPQAA